MELPKIHSILADISIKNIDSFILSTIETISRLSSNRTGKWPHTPILWSFLLLKWQPIYYSLYSYFSALNCAVDPGRTGIWILTSDQRCQIFFKKSVFHGVAKIRTKSVPAPERKNHSRSEKYRLWSRFITAPERYSAYGNKNPKIRMLDIFYNI